MTTSRPMIGSVLAAWFLIVLVAGYAGVFDAGPVSRRSRS